MRDDPAVALPTRLRLAMKARRVTFQDLSVETGVSASTLKSWRRKESPAMPRADNLHAVAEALDTTWDWLLGIDPSAAPPRCGTTVTPEARRAEVPAAAGAARLSRSVDLDRLAEAFGEARARTGGGTVDDRQLMELAVMLYDAFELASTAAGGTGSSA